MFLTCGFFDLVARVQTCLLDVKTYLKLLQSFHSAAARKRIFIIYYRLHPNLPDLMGGVLLDSGGSGVKSRPFSLEMRQKQQFNPEIFWFLIYMEIQYLSKNPSVAAKIILLRMSRSFCKVDLLSFSTVIVSYVFCLFYSLMTFQISGNQFGMDCH